MAHSTTALLMNILKLQGRDKYKTLRRFNTNLQLPKLLKKSINYSFFTVAPLRTHRLLNLAKNTKNDRCWQWYIENYFIRIKMVSYKWLVFLKDGPSNRSILYNFKIINIGSPTQVTVTQQCFC